MTPTTPDTLTLLQRWVAAPWALLLRLTRRRRSPRPAQPYRRPWHAPLRDNEFR
jgi:hypothetical protein